MDKNKEKKSLKRKREEKRDADVATEDVVPSTATRKIGSAKRKGGRPKKRAEEPPTPMEVTGDGEEEEPPKEYPTRLKSQDSLNKVLGNGLIAEKLASYLNLADMKAMRATSHAFNNSILSTRAFGNMSGLHICSILMERKSQGKVLKKTEYQWKGASIDASIDPKFISSLECILPSLKRLQLRLPHCHLNRLEEEEMITFTRKAISKSTNLKALHIKTELFEYQLRQLFRDYWVRKVLRGLEEFEFGTELQGVRDLVQFEGQKTENKFSRNIRRLCSIGWKLESLKLGKLYIHQLQDDTSDDSDMEQEQNVPDNNFPYKRFPKMILSTNLTLKELHLHIENVWENNAMQGIICPHLKRLELTSTDVGNPNVCTFLNNQPPLEELTVRIREEFSTKILSILGGKKGANLKKLHLTAKRFKVIDEEGVVGGGEDHAKCIDWSFLSRLGQLVDFSFTRPYDNNVVVIEESQQDPVEGTGVSFLRNLPTTLRKLKLFGIRRFWLDSQKVPYSASTRMDSDGKLQLIGRFPLLTDLSVTRCDPNALDDTVFQHVLKTCQLLKKLDISHTTLSGYGITGITSRPMPKCAKQKRQRLVQNIEGISLRSLKGLTSLSIRSCPQLTMKWILIAVKKLPHLRKLEFYTSENETTTAQLKKLVGQNPSLEVINVHIQGYEHDKLKAKQVLKLIKKLQKTKEREFDILNLTSVKDFDQIDPESDADLDYNYEMDSDSDVESDDFDLFVHL